MVGPERKREAVRHVRRELEVSERRACTMIRKPRSTQRYRGQRRGSSESGTQRLRSERVNQVWSDDFVFDQTADGRRLNWLPIGNEFSRELVALEVERRMEAKDVTAS